MRGLNHNPIEEIAQLALGEINHRLSRGRELRFGSKGSKVLNIATCEWFDHEMQEGGGLPQLILRAGIVDELNEAISYAALLEVQEGDFEGVEEETSNNQETDFERLWDRGKSIARNSKGDWCFKMRGVELPDDCSSIRFFEKAKIKGFEVPAVGAAFKKVGSSKITGIMFTHLDGFKKGDLGKSYALGSNKANAAIQISTLKPNDSVLGIGEGIETTLSIRRFKGFESLPVWACGDAGNLANFSPPPQIKDVIVAVDNDDAGVRAFTKFAIRMKAFNVNVFSLISPIPKEDLNDFIQRNGENPYDI